MAAESLVQMLEEIAVGLKAGDEEIYGWLRQQLKECGGSEISVELAMGVIAQALAGRGARQSRSRATARAPLGALSVRYLRSLGGCERCFEPLPFLRRRREARSAAMPDARRSAAPGCRPRRDAGTAAPPPRVRTRRNSDVPADHSSPASASNASSLRAASASALRVFSLQAVSARAVGADGERRAGHRPRPERRGELAPRSSGAARAKLSRKPAKPEELAERAQHDDVAAPDLIARGSRRAGPTSMKASSTRSRPPRRRRRSASASSASLATIRPSGLFGIDRRWRCGHPRAAPSRRPRPRYGRRAAPPGHARHRSGQAPRRGRGATSNDACATRICEPGATTTCAADGAP